MITATTATTATRARRQLFHDILEQEAYYEGGEMAVHESFFIGAALMDPIGIERGYVYTRQACFAYFGA